MTSDYKAIKGLGTGRGKLQPAMRTRVYEGPDHLLIVLSTGYTEEYKRVFYRDVRYVVAQKNLGQVWQGVISLLFFIGICLLLLAGVPTLVDVLLAAPFFVWFIWNLAIGPSCRTYINTDIQTLELPTPRRLNRLSYLTDFLNSKISPGQPRVEPVGA